MKTFMLSALALGISALAAANTIDHAQPRPPSTIKNHTTTITETYQPQEGAEPVLIGSEAGEPVPMIIENSAISTLPPAQISDQTDYAGTLQQTRRQINALQNAGKRMNTHHEAEALARYASQGEALAQNEGRAQDVVHWQEIRVATSDYLFALGQNDTVKAKALITAMQTHLNALPQ